MNAAILRLSARSLLGRARVLALAAPAALLLGLALLVLVATSGDRVDIARSMLQTVGLGVVIPVTVLLGVTTLITSEVDDGSILYLLTKPLRRSAVLASKMTVVLLAALAFGVLPMALAALLLAGGDGGLWWSSLLGGTLAAIAYTGVFTLLALLVRRSVVGALIYWLVWELLLASWLAPARYLSARAYGEAGLDLPLPDDPAVPIWWAVLAALLALGAGVLLGGRRLARTTIADD